MRRDCGGRRVGAGGIAGVSDAARPGSHASGSGPSAAPGADGRAAMARLHEHLLRERPLRGGATPAGDCPHLRGDELADIAMEAADDALMSILRRLDDYRGESRFTAWTWKLPCWRPPRELRRRAWQGRELPLPAGGLGAGAVARAGPHGDAETGELLAAIGDAIRG